EPTPEPTPDPTPGPSEPRIATEVPVVIGEPAVTGAITLPEDAVLPDDATWAIELQYVSEDLEDAPEVIGMDAGDVADTMATEIPFAIVVDLADIDDSLDYTLSAKVLDAEENVLYANDTVILGVIDGEPQESVVVQVQDAPAELNDLDPIADEPEASPAA
ncbi:MAG TPA: YbaY family lipoprotein, partial [Anaerolineae bacterium]|nr:YbaY family lipoprotein [Anaerolineae bacterium]